MTDGSNIPSDPNDPNYQFFIDPSDPEFFNKMNEYARINHNKQELENMRNQALNSVIDNWLQELPPRDMANLFLMLCMLNPYANDKKTITFMASKYQGRLEQRMHDAGMNVDPDYLIKFLLGFE